MNTTFAKHLRSYYANLSKTEQKLADFLLTHSPELATLSIQEIARQAEVSPATLSRFAKKIGYPNFQAFKFALLTSENMPDTHLYPQLKNEDSYYTIMQKAFQANMNALTATSQLIQAETLNAAMEKLIVAQCCGFFGLGGSNLLAATAYHKFLRTSLTCFYHEDFHVQQMLAARMTPNDCAILISHTGQNKDLLRIATILEEKGVPIIAITSHQASLLTKKATVTLPSIAEETIYQPEALASIVSQISLIDTLFLSYSMKTQQHSHQTLQAIRQVIHDTRV